MIATSLWLRLAAGAAGGLAAGAMLWSSRPAAPQRTAASTLALSANRSATLGVQPAGQLRAPAVLRQGVPVLASAVVTNQGDRPVALRVRLHALAGDGAPYLSARISAAGRPLTGGSVAWLAAWSPTAVRLAPGQSTRMVLRVGVTRGLGEAELGATNLQLQFREGPR